MPPDPPAWRSFPILQELHDQWWRARGGRLDTTTRPFSRDWEQLLEDAGLLSAELRAEADRDARTLATTGLIELRPPRFRPHLIDRILVPLEAQTRLALLFGDPLDPTGPPPDLAKIPWQPELAFVLQSRPTLALDDLLALNQFLAADGHSRPLVPIKERSLQLFGDEKRLDALLVTAPFRNGTLSPETLRCYLVPEPLGWRRGTLPQGPIIVLENLATWDTYVRWDTHSPQFSAIVYGKGLVFADAVTRLNDIFAELDGLPRPVLYFGDLDPAGLDIPRRASLRAVASGLPPIQPHTWSYQQLLALDSTHATPHESLPVSEESLQWLGDLAEPARPLLARGHRLAQEHLGWDFLFPKLAFSH